jgi:hypothetical protein
MFPGNWVTLGLDDRNCKSNPEAVAIVVAFYGTGAIPVPGGCANGYDGSVKIYAMFFYIGFDACF